MLDVFASNCNGACCTVRVTSDVPARGVIGCIQCFHSVACKTLVINGLGM